MKKSIHQYTTREQFNLEYSIVGNGEPVLVMHGGHSSCHEELGYSELTAHNYSVITPSRPGYGKTSAELGETLISACEAYIELLDDLHIPKVHVIAISAGGPSGIQLASRYPHRVKSLVLQSAVAQRWLTPDDKLYKSSQIMFRPPAEKYLWAMTRLVNTIFPAFLFNRMIASFSTQSKERVLQQISEDDRGHFKRMMNRQRSGHGFMIDLDQAGDDRIAVLSEVRCPALIMHSIHDATVSLEHAHHAYRHIPNAQLCELDSWGHLIWLGSGARDMHHRLFAFLEKQQT